LAFNLLAMSQIQSTPGFSVHLLDGGIAKISLSNEINSEEAMKSAFLQFVAHAVSNNVTKVLVHNHELSHHVSNHMQDWAKTSLELPLLHNGIDKIAIVLPNKREFFSLISTSDTARKKYFENESDAITWLNS